MVVKVKADPVNMVIVQTYLPTTEYEDEEVDKLYDQLEEILGRQTGTDNVIVMGDINAVVGGGKEDRVLGKWGQSQEKNIFIIRKISQEMMCKKKKKRKEIFLLKFQIFDPLLLPHFFQNVKFLSKRYVADLVVVCLSNLKKN